MLTPICCKTSGQNIPFFILGLLHPVPVQGKFRMMYCELYPAKLYPAWQKTAVKV